MKEPVIAIFDIGKTNKKFLLFSSDLRMVFEKEERFEQIFDDDGFECDDIEHIEQWIRKTVRSLVHSDTYELTAVNFTTYGATLAYLDRNGQRLTPIYNYLKPVDESIPESLYKRNGGRDEFCRRTASPALGMLNSGIQALRLMRTKPAVFSKIENILHFPQYVSYILTGRIYSEHTSIGCHTALWDFDNMRYHAWIEAYGLKLPQPVPVNTVTEVNIESKKIRVGIGMHDSSASLAPYFSIKKGRFILLSTGTWCINMNPFNKEILTTEQLDRDCLCYMSITGQPVKSSRFFLGHLHEEGLKFINAHFNKPEDFFKQVKTSREMVSRLKIKYGINRVFFQSEYSNGQFRRYIDMYEFSSFEEAYHQLMIELCDFVIDSVKLVIPQDDDIENLYITGGFSKNELFLHLVCKAFPDKKIFTSEIANSSALGAALVMNETVPEINLGLTACMA
ncbi:MAG TPA: FGGY family carbohydrate kinase [Bacteroidales bacterium]|nr:FGGY family carbohydrate kinase [Bacteroidales bacterium]